jgi:hypothetical protein
MNNDETMTLDGLHERHPGLTQALARWFIGAAYVYLRIIINHW